MNKKRFLEMQEETSTPKSLWQENKALKKNTPLANQLIVSSTLAYLTIFILK